MNELLDNAWILFQNVEDHVSREIVDAVIFFHRNYDFNIDELPPRLLEEVTHRLYEESVEEEIGVLYE